MQAVLGLVEGGDGVHVILTCIGKALDGLQHFDGKSLSLEDPGAIQGEGGLGALDGIFGNGDLPLATGNLDVGLFDLSDDGVDQSFLGAL